MLIQPFLIAHCACLVLLIGPSVGAGVVNNFTFSNDKLAAVESFNNVQMGMMTTELLHFDHDDSPLRVSEKNATMHERLVEAGNRGHKRAAILFAKIRATIDGNYENAASLESLLTYNGFNYGYLIVMRLGSPPVKFQFIFDTGSGLTWVGCNHRRYKGVAVPSFNSSNSSTYKDVPCESKTCQAVGTGCYKGICTFNYSYADGSSLLGNLAYDTLTMTRLDGSLHEFSNFMFGCANHLLGQYDIQGVTGWDRNFTSLPSQLSKVIPNKFSYCLVPYYNANNLTSTLKLGAAAQLHGAAVQTTPFVSNRAIDEFYSLNLLAITLGNVTAYLPPQNSSLDPNNGTLIDSGTTYTYVATAVFAPLAKAFMQATSDLPPANGSKAGLELCVNVRQHRNYTFPRLTLHFENATMHLPKDNYLVPISHNIICLNMIASTSDAPELTIIGYYYHQNFEVLYDNMKSQLSFALKDCSYTSSFSPP